MTWEHNAAYLPGYWYLHLGRQVWKLKQTMSNKEVFDTVAREMGCVVEATPGELVRSGYIWYWMVDRPGVSLENVARLTVSKMKYLYPHVPKDRETYLQMLDWAAMVSYNTIRELLR